MAGVLTVECSVEGHIATMITKVIAPAPTMIRPEIIATGRAAVVTVHVTGPVLHSLCGSACLAHAFPAGAQPRPNAGDVHRVGA